MTPGHSPKCLTLAELLYVEKKEGDMIFFKGKIASELN